MPIPIRGALFERASPAAAILFCAIALAACSSAEEKSARVQVRGAAELVELFEAHGYRLDHVRSTGRVPPIHLTAIPPDLEALPLPEMESTFVRILLPAIAAIDAEIASNRQRVLALAARGATVPTRPFLVNLAQRYGVAPGDTAELRARVDTIPASLALAQGIDESGWGRSRLAREGNALFGQHLPRHTTGRSIGVSGSSVRLAAFDSVRDATAAYVHNLNTERAYVALRELRAKRARAREAAGGFELAGALVHYSERGSVYVKSIRGLIRAHRLGDFDGVSVDSTLQPLVVHVER